MTDTPPFGSFSLSPVASPIQTVSEPTGDWPQPPRPLAETGVAVWCLRAPLLARHADDLATLLSPDELHRRDRLIREEDRTRFTLFRGALRRILAGHLNRDPASLQFDYSPNGKPTLSPTDNPRSLTFNLSHTRDVMVLVCGWTAPLGIDIEWTQRTADVDGIVARFFHPNEQAALANLSPEHKQARFFAWWTAKEAVVKAWGTGISTALPQLDFSRWTNEASAIIEHQALPIGRVFHLDLGAPLASALVVSPAVTDLRLHASPSQAVS